MKKKNLIIIIIIFILVAVLAIGYIMYRIKESKQNNNDFVSLNNNVQDESTQDEKIDSVKLEEEQQPEYIDEVWGSF